MKVSSPPVALGWMATGLALALLGLRLGLLLARDWQRRPAGHRIHGSSPAWLLSLAGMAAAALLHSSSAVCLIVLAWVQSGWLTMAQGLAAVLGANVGTTFTAQTLSMASGGSLGAASGVLALLLSLARPTRYAGYLLLGLAAIALGIEALSAGLLALVGQQVPGMLIHSGGGSPWGAFVVGWVVTALVQSSTLVTSAVVALARNGLIPSPAAVALVLGSNVGTVMTGIMASLILGTRARRLALLDLLANLLPATLLVAQSEHLARLLTGWDPRPERVAANAHTLFNLLTWAACLPWVRRLGRWVGER